MSRTVFVQQFDLSSRPSPVCQKPCTDVEVLRKVLKQGLSLSQAVYQSNILEQCVRAVVLAHCASPVMLHCDGCTWLAGQVM